jgi:hypothetical protein
LSILAVMKIKFYEKIKDEKQLNDIEVKKIEKIYSPIQITKNDLRIFSTIAFLGIDKKQSKNLYNKTTFMAIIKRLNHDFSETKYKFLIRKGMENKLLIKDDKLGYIPASEFIDREYFYKEMCKNMNFT